MPSVSNDRATSARSLHRTHCQFLYQLIKKVVQIATKQEQLKEGAGATYRQDPQKQLKRGKGGLLDPEKDTGHTGAAGSEGN